MNTTQSDAYLSTLDNIITIIHRKMPLAEQTPENLERLLDEVLMHFKYEASQRPHKG